MVGTVGAQLSVCEEWVLGLVAAVQPPVLHCLLLQYQVQKQEVRCLLDAQTLVLQLLPLQRLPVKPEFQESS